MSRYQNNNLLGIALMLLATLLFSVMDATAKWLVSADVSAIQVIAVDIPIGLPDSAEPRAADIEARKLLGKRRSSVFPTPHRAVLEAPTYAKANPDKADAFKAAIAASKKAKQELNDWIETGPERNEENNKKFAGFKERIEKADAKLAEFE